MRRLTKKQQIAIANLQESLIMLGKVGLTGGVYEGSFCVWPEKDGGAIEHGPQFFDQVEEYGMVLNTPGVLLDGGSGW